MRIRSSSKRSIAASGGSRGAAATSGQCVPCRRRWLTEQGPIKLSDLDEPMRRRLYYLVLHDTDLWFDSGLIVRGAAKPVVAAIEPPPSKPATGKAVNGKAPAVKAGKGKKAAVKAAPQPTAGPSASTSTAPIAPAPSASVPIAVASSSKAVVAPPAAAPPVASSKPADLFAPGKPGAPQTSFAEALAFIGEAQLPAGERGEQVERDTQTLLDLLPTDPKQLDELGKRMRAIVAADKAKAGADGGGAVASAAGPTLAPPASSSAGAKASSSRPASPAAVGRTAVVHPSASASNGIAPQPAPSTSGASSTSTAATDSLPQPSASGESAARSVHSDSTALTLQAEERHLDASR